MPLELGPLDLVFREAVLAADFITARETLQVGCACSNWIATVYTCFRVRAVPSLAAPRPKSVLLSHGAKHLDF